MGIEMKMEMGPGMGRLLRLGAGSCRWDLE